DDLQDVSHPLSKKLQYGDDLTWEVTEDMLESDHRYFPTVVAMNEAGTGPAQTAPHFITPAKVPAQPAPIPVLSSYNVIGGSVKISFPTDSTESPFYDPAGVIRRVLVLVAGEGQMGDDTARAGTGGGSPDTETFKTWAQAIDQDPIPVFNAFPEEEGAVYGPDWEFVVGADSSCDKEEKDVYCNGPLPATKNMEVKVRLATDAGWKDSPVVGFNIQAGPSGPEPSTSDDDEVNTALIVGLVAAVAGVIILIAVIIFLGKRRSG
ncbi:unnamed protein product, partial [Cyprideis torosa]